MPLFLWLPLLISQLGVMFPGPGDRTHATTPTLAFVQGCVAKANGATVTCAMVSNITSGNILVAASMAGGAATVLTVTSSAGVSCTWNSVLAATAVSTSFAGGQSYCNIPSTGAQTIQMAATGGSGTFSALGVAEYSSTNGWVSPAFDKVASTAKTVTSTVCPSGSTATTTVANEIVVGVCEAWNSAQTWGAVSGFTNRPTSSRTSLGLYDEPVTATGAQSFAGVLSATDITLSIVSTFKSN